MVKGLRLTISGIELRALLQQRIGEHRDGMARWSKAAAGTNDDRDDAVQMPEHICENEAERLTWRAEVLRFLHDHVVPEETYLLGAADLEFGELLPQKPGWVEQQEYEERTNVGFQLETLTKNVVRREWPSSGSPLADPIMERDDPDVSVTRVDTKGGPEIIMIERK